MPGHAPCSAPTTGATQDEERSMSKRSLAAFLTLVVIGCHPASATSHMHVQAGPELIDTSAIEQALGLKGTTSEGVFKATLPRQDLNVVMDGFPITPRMGLTAWVAFQPHGRKAMLMGD